ncbi:r2r3-MYB transcription factor [Tritrichomonas foetus]|uniref:R2r3-MYB transcription factor n=1 Tax=Tritrichomonas foetus TaxID=1144522 RepID=A0A1J4JLI8_9EUKA|nr:r2r3-MYB transcription factor [Tritrichomonas foetus]|eukprot:OHS99545.1 r2r3-MYB transcription factor [Tritrichomonas foetus]
MNVNPSVNINNLNANANIIKCFLPIQFSIMNACAMMMIPQVDQKKKKSNKKKFTPEEDQIIINLVGDDKYPKWSAICEQIPGKTARQCRERYQHYLAPNISNKPWTEEEEALLHKLYSQFGKNWAKISEFFDGRTNTYLKNKWNLHNRKKMNEDFPTIEETKLSSMIDAETIKVVRHDKKTCKEITTKKDILTKTV